MSGTLTVARQDTPDGRWELVSRPPRPELAPYVRHIAGFAEQTPAPLRRLEYPSAVVVLIIALDHGWSIEGMEGGGPLRSFAAGLSDRPVTVAHDGAARCMEVHFTPLGTRRFFGFPADELTGRAVGLEEVDGRVAELLAERLATLPDWVSRIDALEAELARRLAAGPAPDDGVAWAWRALERADGRVDVGRLAGELGWSHRRLIARFREQVGMPPKRVARLLRFERALALLQSPETSSIAEVAYSCGYADQPHLNREFRELAGASPTDVLARLPGGAGFGA